jgi:hypothetical protein
MQGERIILGRGQSLLYERCQYAYLNFIESNIHRWLMVVR